MLEVVKGDLFDPDFGFEGLAQGVNCQGIMGSGIAVDFRDRYPDMYDSYKAHCLRWSGMLPGTLHFFPAGDLEMTSKFEGPESSGINADVSTPAIFNLFTQEWPGQGHAKMRYLAHSAMAMRLMAEETLWLGLRVGLPWIGCGVGGLEKYNVEHVLRSILEDSAVQFTLVEQ